MHRVAPRYTIPECGDFLSVIFSFSVASNEIVTQLNALIINERDRLALPMITFDM